MSSKNSNPGGLSFSLKLTLWYAFVFTVASAAWFFAVYYLVEDSMDEEWRVTRSRIVSTWSSGTGGGTGFEIEQQRSVIEGSVPADLNTAPHFKKIFYRISLPIIAVGFITGWIVTYRGLRPLRNLGRTVRHILDTGKTSARVPVQSRRGELDELVALFNQMLDKNDRLMKAMHDSLDNVAHDLRTPMTRLRGSAETALQESGDSESYREALKDSMEESDRVLTMLNTLMDVAEAETGAMPLDREDIPVAEIVADVMELYELVAEEKKIPLNTEVPGDLEVHADRTRLRQVLANLVDNAVKYSDEGRPVTVTAREANGRVEIAVADQGPGIPPGELEKIWDRLYRGDLSRGRRGLGLGLSFVKALVEAHGGTVEVESELKQGSCFVISLPGEV